MAELRSWATYSEYKRPFPWWREFRRERKALLYYGVDHVCDPANAMFAEIEHLYSAFHPQVVLIEGTAPFRRQAPESERRRLVERLKRDSPEALIRSWGEPGFVARLAVRDAIPVFCPEPSEQEEIQELERRGFLREQIFLHYMLRAFEQFHRLQNVELDAYYAVNRDHFARITNWAGFDYSLSYLERTAEALWPGEVDLRNPEFVKGKVWPVRYDSIVNEIARASGDIRDQHIYSELVHALELFDRAFVVYGGSHLLRQEPLLEAFFSGGESLR